MLKPIKRVHFFLLAVSFFLIFAEGISAQLSVAGIFSDNMVLQQNDYVNIWGWSAPGDTISITGIWNNDPLKAVTSTDGKWTAKIQTPAAKTDGSSYEIIISGSGKKITFSNILIGEVWLLSGQSNMEMPLAGWDGAPVEGSAQAISTANYPKIRLMTVNRKSASNPQKDITNSANQKWKICTPANVRYFSAAGYFFGRKLHEELGIPVGLVCSSWGGSSCETWANQASLEYVSDYAGNKNWTPESSDDNHTPTVLYNGMIAPLIPFDFAGVCWYQGETNVGRAQQLTELFPAMIEGWRGDFEKENLPFYFVQLAPWGGYGNGSLPEFWEAQAYTLNLHNTEMAATLDVGDADNIHPARKEPVGNRLAQKALANVYGRNSLEYAGPRYDSLKIENNKLRLYFSHTGSGLKAEGDQLQNFEIAGSNNFFYTAQAEIDGNEVLVWNDQINSPKNVRYAWSKNAGASLFNIEGFPAPPFRTNPPAWMQPLKATFKCNSELINKGESVQLEWLTIGGKEVTLNNAPVAFSGKKLVQPDTSTTFTLTTNNDKNSSVQSKTVYVIPDGLNSWSHKKITKASSTRLNYGADLAVDENTGSAWNSNYSNDQWISVDLGKIVPVNLIVLQWGADFGKKYEIQVSDDFENWTTVFSENSGNGGIDFIPDLTAGGRYVRMKGIERNSSRGYQLKEFKIFSTETSRTGTLTDRNDKIMRGTPMVLGKNLTGSVEFATDIKNWETIKNNGFNTIRICWVDPWYKVHGNSYWTVSQVLPYLDKCVDNATKSGMNIIINFHNVGAQQNFDTNYTFTLEKEFWDSVAPRYKDNDLVYYEIANEPTFHMNDYLKPIFKQNLLDIYNSIREKAPERQILMFSFNTIATDIVNVVEDYRDALDWEFTAVAYHMYNSNSSQAVQTIMAYHRVICTEWNYNFVRQERPDYSYIRQVDGFKENSQTLEKIGSSWIDWRDWSDTTLNELLDTLIQDAKTKNYWWAEPKAGVKVTNVKISDIKLKLKTGEKKQLTAVVYPALAENQEVTWSTTDENIVSVTENGLVTATATQNKTASVTATTSDGGYKATCEVQVIAPEKKGPYPKGSSHIIPGEINPTYYDLGGEGVGYHDLDANNSGDGIRQEQGVDTEYRLPEGSIGGIQAGEWLEYTVNVETEGWYNIEILFATSGRYGKFHVEFDAENKSGEMYVRPSGSYSSFVPTKIEHVWLNQGLQVMRIFFDYAMYNMGTIAVYKEEATLAKTDQTNNSIRIFPNPVNDKLYISTSRKINNYKVQTMTGQTVLSGFLENKSYIDLNQLVNGNYFLLIAGKGFVHIEKIMKI